VVALISFMVTFSLGWDHTLAIDGRTAAVPRAERGLSLLLVVQLVDGIPDHQTGSTRSWIVCTKAALIMLFFGAVFTCTLFVVFFLPETKGKSLTEIENILKRNLLID